MRDWTKARESLESALVDVVWRQWAVLDSPAGDRSPARTIVDPEALILVSLRLVEQERRVWDLLAWWGRSAPRLLSVQRIKNLAAGFDEETGALLGEFAHLAVKEGNDARWKSFERSRPRLEARRSKMESPAPRLRHPSTLMLLLRRGMGVGIKPDLLTVLIGNNGSQQSVKSLANATGYSSRAVRRAAEEMAEGSLIRNSRDSPVTFTTKPAAWLGVLEPPPKWIPWHQEFACVGSLSTTFRRFSTEDGRYAASSSFRDGAAAYGATLRDTNLEVANPLDTCPRQVTLLHLVLINPRCFLSRL